MFSPSRGACVCVCVLALRAAGLAAQSPAPSGPVAILVEKPIYASASAETTVSRPIAEVWARVGDFCDIRDWIPTACEITSGNENDLGAIRTTGREILVGRTQYSYTYAQAPVARQAYNMYRGTLEARPIDAKTTRLIFTQFSDVSTLPDDAAREQLRTRRITNLSRYLQGMKTVAEGGKMQPPQPGPAPAPPAQPAPAQGPPSPAGPTFIIPVKPTYTHVTAEVAVDKPVAAVWPRVGDLCDIRDWVPTTCEIVSGKENELGSARTTGRDMIIGRTEYSYTYSPPPVAGRPYTLYHGTLEARPASAGTTTLFYSLMFDNSMLPDDAAREKDREERRALITRLVQNMKILAEGGKVVRRP